MLFWRGTRYLLFAVVLCVLATRFNWRDVKQAIMLVNFWYVLPAMAFLTPLSVVLRSCRWRSVLPDGSAVPLRKYVRAYLIGFLANAILVGKLGDIVKARVLCRGEVRMGNSLSSAVLDRVIEGATLLVIVAIALLATPQLPPWAAKVTATAGVLTLTALAGIYVAVSRRSQIVIWGERLLASAPVPVRRTLDGQISKLLDGMSGIHDHRRVAVVCAWNVLVWAVEVLAVIAFLKAFSIPVPPLVAAVVVLLVLNFGTLLPLAPGGVGLYQVLCVLALSIWGIQRELSISFGLVMQAALFIPVYLAGAICMLSWRKADN